MPTIPTHLSISWLFQQQYIFRVPKYQRTYAWYEEEASDFLADIQKCFQARNSGQPRHHFFGGIVSVEQPVPGSSRRNYDLIDGQQRLATFILFVVCIVREYEALELAARAAGDTVNEGLAKDRAKRLREKYLKYEDEVNRVTIHGDRLELSEPDKTFFKGILDRTAVTEARDSHKNINYVLSAITAHVQSATTAIPGIADKLDALKHYEDVLDDCTVIHIVTDSRNEAYRLFQVLNDRGTSLTDGDLLRASTLELLSPPAHANQHAQAESDWNEILREHPTDTENFLRWYYSSRQGRRPSQSGLFDDFLDAFFPLHQNTTISAADAATIVTSIQEIRGEIINCRKLLDGQWPFDVAAPITQWHIDRLRLLVKELGHTNCMPLLLAACKLTPQKFSEVVQAVERFIFRYKFISNLHVGPLTRVYLEQAKAIRANPTGYSIATLRAQFLRLQNNKATDTVFRNGLSTLAYKTDGGNKELKYFLMTLEHYWRWYRDGAQGDPQCLDTTRVFDFPMTTIEHIYPRNAPPAAIVATLEPLKNTPGNLSFLGPTDNQGLGNADFTTKKPVLLQSSVTMNREVGSLAAWDAAALAQRQNELINIALKIFCA